MNCGGTQICLGMASSCEYCWGMLCVWNNNNFQVDFRLSEKGLILLEGVWMADMQRVVVANIYAPCDIEGKRQL